VTLFSDLPAQSQIAHLSCRTRENARVGLIFIASMAAVERASDTPSLFEQYIGALLEAEDALEYTDDEVEQITSVS